MSKLGTHIVADLYGASRLDDEDFIEGVLESCAKAAGAKVLLKNTHLFTPENGVSSLIVLMESHVSIHTWPEKGTAAFDAFMCGAAQPRLCIPVLKQAFSPFHMHVQELPRCPPQRTVPNETGWEFA
ncbi:adenosylmethionine decarboxylase [Sinorhizobium numidicum]|uniref:Adenosylmethionine decarboxylase n=1 Tax=Sinorhizobium numidicum TaxID=680248 RepID=A0ABY8CRG7_9HYPH|nr:adenosylmethionine decarboxylase [Sinorhizobium numidicum]WEX74774.1 adenosylmethionine decarboxylase [Sinorhizobium numidicum]WEX80767.1 adenosylmethionine decarboxylase [Sinorhizobium numidicum]